MFLGKRKSLPKTKIWDVSSTGGSYAYTLKHTVVTKRIYCGVWVDLSVQICG